MHYSSHVLINANIAKKQAPAVEIYISVIHFVLAEMRFWIDEGNRESYIEIKEEPKFILGLEEEGLFILLGRRRWEIDRMGYFDPSTIYKMDFGKIGKKTFEEYLPLIRERICKMYEALRESGVLDDMYDLYLFLMGFYIGQGVNRALAAGMAGIIAKRGLTVICD